MERHQGPLLLHADDAAPMVTFDYVQKPLGVDHADRVPRRPRTSRSDSRRTGHPVRVRQHHRQRPDPAAPFNPRLPAGTRRRTTTIRTSRAPASRTRRLHRPPHHARLLPGAARVGDGLLARNLVPAPAFPVRRFGLGSRRRRGTPVSPFARGLAMTYRLSAPVGALRSSLRLRVRHAACASPPPPAPAAPAAPRRRRRPPPPRRPPRDRQRGRRLERAADQRLARRRRPQAVGQRAARQHRLRGQQIRPVDDVVHGARRRQRLREGRPVLHRRHQQGQGPVGRAGAPPRDDHPEGPRLFDQVDGALDQAGAGEGEGRHVGAAATRSTGATPSISTTRPQTFVGVFTMEEDDDPTAELAFHFGGANAGETQAPYTVCFDDMHLDDPKFVKAKKTDEAPIPASPSTRPATCRRCPSWPPSRARRRRR